MTHRFNRHPSIINGIPYPPHGFTEREEARWWTMNPDLLQIAFSTGSIALGSDNFKAIERAAKDTDLAQKVIDSKKVAGLSKVERARLYEILTDGGVWGTQEAKRGPKPNTKQALDVADGIAGLEGREANEMARNIAGNKYHGNTSKLTKRAKQAEDARKETDQLGDLAVKKISDYFNGHALNDEMAETMIQAFIKLLPELKETSPEFIKWVSQSE